MIYYTRYSYCSDMSVHSYCTVGDVYVGSILFSKSYILGLFSLVTYVFVMCGHKMIMTSNQADFIIILKIYH